MEVDSLKITIRPYEISDVDDFMVYAGDDRVSRFTRWDTFTSKDEALGYIKDFFIPHPYCRSICVDDRSIGFITIMPTSDDDRCRADIGYALAAEYWGKGIVARALKIAVVEAFKELPYLVRLQALVESENEASQRVLEKVGFLREGLLRKYAHNKGEIKDVVLFNLLSTDPMF